MWHALQAVGVGDLCVPVSAKPVVLWSNAAVVQLTVVWQEAQFAAAKDGPDVEWTGLLVCCQVERWHAEFPQSVGAIVKVKLLLMWQAAQATLAWPLVSGKPVLL